jgi:SlyX protein
MQPTSNTEAGELDARVEKLEIRAAYQDQVVEDLNKTITAQWARIESLALQIKRLVDRLQQVEHGGTGDPADEPPPPHY